MVFSYLASGGLTKLQWFVSNSQLYRQPLIFEKLNGSIDYSNDNKGEKEEEKEKEEEEDRQT